MAQDIQRSDMLGKMLLIAWAPFALAFIWARYYSDTEADARRILIVGVVGSLCVAGMAYIDHCVKKEDGDDNE